MKKQKIEFKGLDELKSNVVEIIKSHDNYDIRKNNLNIILDNIILKDYVSDIEFDDSFIYINLSKNMTFAINYDYKNYPLMSFDCSEVLISLTDEVINFDCKLLLNISDNIIELKNIYRIC